MSTLDQNPTGSDGPTTPDPTERRRWPRYPDKDKSRVWFSTAVRGAQRGQLDDISLGGLSIRVSDASQLLPGARIVIGLDEWMIPVTVKHVQPGGNAGYRVGMEWVRSGSPAVAGLVNRYRQAAIAADTETIEAPAETDATLPADSDAASGVAAE